MFMLLHMQSVSSCKAIPSLLTPPIVQFVIVRWVTVSPLCDCTSPMTSVCAPGGAKQGSCIQVLLTVTGLLALVFENSAAPFENPQISQFWILIPPGGTDDPS